MYWWKMLKNRRNYVNIKNKFVSDLSWKNSWWCRHTRKIQWHMIIFQWLQFDIKSASNYNNILAGRTRKSFDWKALIWYTAVKLDYSLWKGRNEGIYNIVNWQNRDLDRAVRGDETKYNKNETCIKENTVSLSIRGVLMNSS